MRDLNRRELLRSGAVLAGGAAAAGVSAGRLPAESVGGSDGSLGAPLPGWADWVPDPSETPTPDQFRSVFRYEMASLLQVENLKEQLESDDPLANPLSAGFAGSFYMLALQQTGIGEPIIGPLAESDDPDPADVPTEDAVLTVAGTAVYRGSFDTAALQSAVDAGDFTESDTDGIYVHGEQDQAVQWSDSWVAVAPTGPLVNGLVSTKQGRSTRWYDASDDFRWLLENGVGKGFDVVSLADQPQTGLADEQTNTDYTAFEGCLGFAQTAAIDDQGAVSDPVAAVVYPDEDAVDGTRLQTGLGASADDLDQDGRYVVVRADAQGTGETSTPTSDTPTDDGTPTTDGTPLDDGTPTDTAMDGDATTTEGEDEESDDTGGSAPGMGVVGTVAAVLGGGYLLGSGSDDE
jgi:hypothetical protein